MREFFVTKRTMRSCKRSKYWYVWGAAMIVPLVRTGWMVIDADGAIIVTIGATASGTPMECPPPSTSETVGFFIPEMSSAMASPASTSPPTVLSRNKTPSMSSLSSKYASSGSTCSYFVAFCVFGSCMCPSICPAIVRQWMAARLFLMTTEPKSMTG